MALFEKMISHFLYGFQRHEEIFECGINPSYGIFHLCDLDKFLILSEHLKIEKSIVH